MTDDIRDVEMPVGFTGKWKKLRDFTDGECWAYFDRAFDMLDVQGFTVEDLPCDIAIQATAKYYEFPEENVRAWVDRMVELAEEAEILADDDPVDADERMDGLRWYDPLAEELPGCLGAMYFNAFNLMTMQVEREGKTGAEAAEWYRAYLTQRRHEAEPKVSQAAKTLASRYDEIQELRMNGARAPYLAQVGDGILVAEPGASNGGTVDGGFVVDRFPPEVALAYIYESDDTDGRKVATQDQLTETYHPASRWARRIARKVRRTINAKATPWMTKDELETLAKISFA